MKKKILTAALAVCMLATLVIGMSLAYFTDTKTAENTFTVGNVAIDLHEKNADGSTFTQNQRLMPGDVNHNAVAKRVTVENTGANDAWVWVEMKIPTALLAVTQTNSNETDNSLHYNSYGHFTVEYNPGGQYAQTPITDGVLNSDGTPVDPKMVAVADGLWNDFKWVGTEGDYTILRATMEKTLASGKVSLPVLRQVYMDKRVTGAANGYKLVDDTVYSGSWEIIVNAYAIQADGFTTVDDAIAAYYAA